MSQSDSSPMPHSPGSIREELDFIRALFYSLEDTQDAAQAVSERERLAQKIKKLQTRLTTMQEFQHANPLPQWGREQSSHGERPLRSPQLNGDSAVSNLPAYPDVEQSPSRLQPQPTKTNLPNRKRPSVFDEDEDDNFNYPAKSRRSTPVPPPDFKSSVEHIPPSYSLTDDNFLLGSFQDDFLGEMFPSNATVLQHLEAKRRQEEEDAKFAAQLQEAWDKEIAKQPSLSAPKGYNTTQSYMRPDGSWRKPSPSSSIQQVKTEFQPENAIPRSYTPQTDSSSGLEEISANDFRSSAYNRPVVGTRENNTTFGMPGSFPGNGFASRPGSSVYGSASRNPTNYSPSVYGTTWDSFNGGLFSSFGTGSSSYDLDPLPPSWSTSSHYPSREETQEELKQLLQHIRPDEELTPEQLREAQPEALKIDLMPHQRKGFAWMKQMEEGTNKGGILADDMGLGKTVQALSLILARPPSPDKKRPTLIVAPVALMQQWEREIQKFVKKTHQLQVLILHQENRNKSWGFIRHYDVVITTYGTLGSELKRKQAWETHVNMVENARPGPQQQLPLLGENVIFHRIILDEAQNIKNKNTKAAVAACKIQAEYRWALSGTPMQNNVDEIYSLIKFCRIKPYSDYEKFARDISRPLKANRGEFQTNNAMERLQALLRAILLRRTKKSEIDGKPIIQLPEKHIVEERAFFNKDELDFYKALETQAQIQFNKYLRAGTVGRNYSHALVLLLRLRQCCCSAQLVSNAKDFMTSGTIDGIDYLENAKSLPSDVIRRLDANDAFECPICMDAVENPIIFNPCGHSLCEDCLSAMTEKAMEDISTKLLCPHCRAEINIHKVTNLESYLRVHHPDREGVQPIENDAEAEETDSDSDTDSDPDSDESDADDGSDNGADLKDFIVDDEEPAESEPEDEENGNEKKKKSSVALQPDEVDGNSKAREDEKTKSDIKKKTKVKAKSKGKSKGKGKRKPKRKQLVSLADYRREGLKNKKAKRKYLRQLAKGYIPSAKIERTIELLAEIQERGQGEKTIVFSSFTSFLDLLEVPLSRDEHLENYVRYDGSMKASDRHNSVITFTDDPRCKVILVSLKAGNAGLNLTAANHVIILDPFWNPFVEHQAADRCYRIGQTREVTVHRILIGDESDKDGERDPNKQFTVEDRILHLQEKKRLLVETALDEKAAKGFSRLSTRDLGYLFGVNSMDGI